MLSKEKGKTMLYIAGMLLSIGFIFIAMTLLGETKIVAPIIIVLSVYLFVGSLIKLCRKSDKLKDKVICAIDLLFWLP